MSKPIVFDADETALCPNGHGRMLMVRDTPYAISWNRNFFANPTTPGGIPLTRSLTEREFQCLKAEFTAFHVVEIPEARAHCLECGHTMIVADEREA